MDDKQRNNYKRSCQRAAERVESKRLRLENLIKVTRRRFPCESEDGNSVETDACGETNLVDECARDVLSDGENYDSNNNSSSSSSLDTFPGGSSPSGSSPSSSSTSSSSSNDSSDPSSSDSDSSNSSDSSSDNEENDNNFEFANDEEKGQYVEYFIRKWALEGGLSNLKLDKLLRGLKPVHKNLPLSYMTLLRTPKNVPMIEFNGGCQMWYKGLRANFNHFNLAPYLERYNRISIDLNMDGVPLFKRSEVKFYAILGRLVGAKYPFIVGIFFGKRDPTTNELLTDLTNELQILEEEGFNYHGNVYVFEVRHYICDALARALVKCIIEHNGYFSCEKCLVEGEWIEDRITFVDITQPLRTDNSFLNQDNPEHHVGVSPLVHTNWQPVSQTRLDVLHLVHIGVYKRQINLVWRKWNGPWKLHRNQLNEISVKMLDLCASCPCDFNRLPRSLSEIALFNGSEYRRSLLYDGVLVFRDTVDENVYKHFLLLHAAMSILSSPRFYLTKNAVADEALRLFITHSAEIYGEKFVSYNVHSLSHFATECAQHGPADTFSAYCYESKLGFIKHSLRSGFKPLQQAANRDLERIENNVVFIEEENNEVILAKMHVIPHEVVEGDQYKYLKVNGSTWKLNRKDCGFQTCNYEVVILSNIVCLQNEIYLVGYPFLHQEDLYEYPFPSSDIGIFSVSELSDERRAYPLHEVSAKCWLMPDGDAYACFPLCHSQID